MEIVNKLYYEKLNKPVIEFVENEKQEFKLIDTITRTKGLRLFSFNPYSHKVTEVTFKKSKTAILTYDDHPHINDYEKAKVVVDPRNIHFEALNYNSAQKRIEKYLSGKIKYLSNLKHYIGTISFF